jgi:lipid A disaccharide synthetase
MNVDNIVTELNELLNNAANINAMKQDFLQLKLLLKAGSNASEKAAQWVCSVANHAE